VCCLWGLLLFQKGCVVMAKCQTCNSCLRVKGSYFYCSFCRIFYTIESVKNGTYIVVQNQELLNLMSRRIEDPDKGNIING
jgi:hypothetical protein